MGDRSGTIAIVLSLLLFFPLSFLPFGNAFAKKCEYRIDLEPGNSDYPIFFTYSRSFPSVIVVQFVRFYTFTGKSTINNEKAMGSKKLFTLSQFPEREHNFHKYRLFRL